MNYDDAHQSTEIIELAIEEIDLLTQFFKFLSESDPEIVESPFCALDDTDSILIN